jgi:plasmid stabilization system protein ParE
MAQIRLSEDAQEQLKHIAAYYVEKAYDSASARLVESVAFVLNPKNLPRHIFHPAPRPAPGLKSLGLSWLLHHRYWFAFTNSTPPVIVAIIDATSNIPRHATHLRSPPRT